MFYRRQLWPFGLIFAAAALAMPCVSHGHGLEGVETKARQMDHQRTRVEPRDQNAGATFKPQIAEGVIDSFKLWLAGSSVRACFFRSDPATSATLIDIAKTWLRHANLDINFGSNGKVNDCSVGGPYQIRVSFESTGNWSYVGTDAIRADLAKPSMNIESGLSGGRITDNSLFRVTVLHEFGHAIGMQHEHQSPESRCGDDVRWDVVYKFYLDNFGWSKEKVDFNFQPLVNSPRLRTTEYDRLSIMHYSLPAWMFRDKENSRCYVNQAQDISQLDVAAISMAYPPAPKDQLTLINSRAEFAKSILSTLGFSETQRSQLGNEANKILRSVGHPQDISFSGCVNKMEISGNKNVVLNCPTTGGGGISIEVK